MNKNKWYKKWIFWDIVSLSVGIVLGILIQSVTPDLKGRPFFDVHRFIWFLWGMFTPIIAEQSIKFFFKSQSMDEIIQKLNKTLDLLYKDRVGDDLLTFLTEFSEPIKDLIRLDKFSENGYRFTESSLKEMLKSGMAKVNSRVAEYITHLEKVLALTTDSIWLTCLVPPQWFFEDDDSSLRVAEKSHDPLPSATKKQILQKYENVTLRKDSNKIRIVIYDQHDIDEIENSKDKYINGIKNLTKLNSSFSHYFTTESLLREGGIDVIEDYAIFDQRYFLQYNLKTEVIRAGWHKTALTPRNNLFIQIKDLKTNQRLFDSFDSLISYLKGRNVL